MTANSNDSARFAFTRATAEARKRRLLDVVVVRFQVLEHLPSPERAVPELSFSARDAVLSGLEFS